MATHYEVLNASPSSTLEEIRACYRAALLLVHPDKLGSQRPNSGSGIWDADGKEDVKDVSSRYLRVQEAWNVLRDADSRARYDALVKSLRVGGKGDDADVVVGEEVVLEDMEECVSETSGDVEYWYPCRCSDFFVVGARELQNAGVGFGDKSSSGASSEANAEECGDGGTDGGVHWDRQRQSIVLPCGSCSLHLRVYFWVPCS